MSTGNLIKTSQIDVPNKQGLLDTIEVLKSLSLILIKSSVLLCHLIIEKYLPFRSLLSLKRSKKLTYVKHRKSAISQFILSFYYYCKL